MNCKDCKYFREYNSKMRVSLSFDAQTSFNFCRKKQTFFVFKEEICDNYEFDPEKWLENTFEITLDNNCIF